MARLPKSIIKKYGISKKAWSVFRGRKKKRSSVSKRKNVKRRGYRRMARRKRRRGGKSLTQQAFKWIRIGALVAPAAQELVFGADTMPGKIRHTLRRYTGYDYFAGTWDAGALLEGWGPYLGAVLATYGIPKIASILRRL